MVGQQTSIFSQRSYNYSSHPKEANNIQTTFHAGIQYCYRFSSCSQPACCSGGRFALVDEISPGSDHGTCYLMDKFTEQNRHQTINKSSAPKTIACAREKTIERAELPEWSRRFINHLLGLVIHNGTGA